MSIFGEDWGQRDDGGVGEDVEGDAKMLKCVIHCFAVIFCFTFVFNKAPMKY